MFILQANFTSSRDTLFCFSFSLSDTRGEIASFYTNIDRVGLGTFSGAYA